jgi:hypothetical protein
LPRYLSRTISIFSPLSAAFTKSNHAKRSLHANRGPPDATAGYIVLLLHHELAFATFDLLSTPLAHPRRKKPIRATHHDLAQHGGHSVSQYQPTSRHIVADQRRRGSVRQWLLNDPPVARKRGTVRQWLLEDQPTAAAALSRPVKPQLAKNPWKPAERKKPMAFLDLPAGMLEACTLDVRD